jgi:hypothetical protein
VEKFGNTVTQHNGVLAVEKNLTKEKSRHTETWRKGGLAVQMNLGEEQSKNRDVAHGRESSREKPGRTAV